MMEEVEQHSTEHTLLVEIVRADQKQVLENLLMLYLYDLNDIDLSVFCMPLDVNGRLEYPNLERYWKESGCYPYFILLNEHPVGCCLVHQQPFYPASVERTTHVIGEFFIAKMYRRHHIGAMALQQITLQHPGDWEVRVIRAHTKGQQFWEKAINHLEPSRAEVRDVDDSVWNGFIYSFTTNNASGN